MDLAKELHGEHLTTQSQTRRILNRILINLKANPANISNLETEIDYAFKDCKICIITKDESKRLDGKGEIYTKKEITSYLGKIKKRFNNLPKDFEKDCLDFVGQRKKHMVLVQLEYRSLWRKLDF